MPPSIGGRKQHGCLRTQQSSKEYLLADGQLMGEANSGARLIRSPICTQLNCWSYRNRERHVTDSGNVRLRWPWEAPWVLQFQSIQVPRLMQVHIPVRSFALFA